MKNEKEKIDILLEHNADRQLAGVDWEQLGVSISRRVDEAQRNKSGGAKYGLVFKIAGGIGAAAVIFVAVMVLTDARGGLKIPEGSRAVVKMVERKGSTVVEIKGVTKRSQVSINIGGRRREIAKCEVKIIDLNGDMKERWPRATWIIITRPKPVTADNGLSRDEIDLICML